MEEKELELADFDDEETFHEILDEIMKELEEKDDSDPSEFEDEIRRLIEDSIESQTPSGGWIVDN